MPVVASYNIHSCFGRDGLLSPERVVGVIRELDADIVALQEVDAQHRVGGYLDQWVYLARELSYFCTPGISLRTHRRNYGNALLTRMPVDDVRLHDLSVDRREPRGAVEVLLHAEPRRPLRVVATHLGLRRAERTRQIELLSGLLGQSDCPLVLLGDFNEWNPLSRNLRRLRSTFGSVAAPPTFPVQRPLLALDRILTAGAVALEAMSVHRSALAEAASDHLPVRAHLRWTGEETATCASIGAA